MKLAKRLLAVAVWLAMALGVTGQVTATVVLDQQNVIPASDPNQTSFSSQQTPGTFNQFAQTFTVGVAGTLVRIDVEIYNDTNPDGSKRTNGSVHVDLTPTTGAGVPDSSGLASWNITGLTSGVKGSFVSLDLGADAFAVSPGQIYAIEFTWIPPSCASSGCGSGFEWVSGVSDTYTGGSAFHSNFGANPTPWVSSSYDYGFRTFVDVPGTAVPEPSIMILLGCGLLYLVCFRRRRLFKR